MQKILLDTDIGGDIDDAVCLAYLLREPRCELIGITTVCGESQKRAAVASAICKAAGRDIPIAAGMDRPLRPSPVYPTPDGAQALSDWPHNTYAQSNAPAFLYQAIRANPGEVVLLGIGNMTNIAALLTAYPDAASLLKGLYVMNGYFGAQALPEAWYNWNSWADPLASQIVFAAEAPVHRAVTLEITDRLTMAADRAAALLGGESPLLRAVLDFGQAWLKSADRLTLHDPLAAACVFHPGLCRFERGFVQVETEREAQMGATAFTPSKEGNVEISRDVNAERFYQILSETLRGRGEAD